LCFAAHLRAPPHWRQPLTTSVVLALGCRQSPRSGTLVRRYTRPEGGFPCRLGEFSFRGPAPDRLAHLRRGPDAPTTVSSTNLGSPQLRHLLSRNSASHCSARLAAPPDRSARRAARHANAGWLRWRSRWVDGSADRTESKAPGQGVPPKRTGPDRTEASDPPPREPPPLPVLRSTSVAASSRRSKADSPHRRTSSPVVGRAPPCAAFACFAPAGTLVRPVGRPAVSPPSSPLRSALSSPNRTVRRATASVGGACPVALSATGRTSPCPAVACPCATSPLRVASVLVLSSS
jgi:hypothetical protein